VADPVGQGLDLAGAHKAAAFVPGDQFLAHIDHGDAQAPPMVATDMVVDGVQHALADAAGLGVRIDGQHTEIPAAGIILGLDPDAGAGFAAGAAALYVGTATLVNGLAALNDVFHLVCDAGGAVAEAVSVVNDHLRYTRNDLPYFTPLGLPWLRTAVAEGVTRPADPLAERGTGRIVVRGGEQSGDLGVLAGLISGLADGKAPHHVVFSSPRTADVLSAFDAAMSVDAGELVRLRSRIRALGEGIVALEQMPLLGFRYARQGNLHVTLRDQIISLAQAMQTATAFGDPTKLAKRVASLESGLGRAERGLADALWERGTSTFVNFDDMWGEVLEQQPPVPFDRPCVYCGRSVVQLIAEHPLIPGLARSGLVCARCCMIFDRDPRSPVTEAELRCPNVWRRGETVDIALRLVVAPGDRVSRSVRAIVGVHTEACDRNHVGFAPPTELTLEPGAVQEVKVSARVFDDAHMHQEYLRAFVVANGTLTIATRPVYVRPAGFPADGESE